MSRTAQVKRDARMGEAEARRDAGIRVSLATIYTVCSMAHCSIAEVLLTCMCDTERFVSDI